MFEHTGRLLKALGERIGSWNWSQIGHDVSLVHGIWTGAMVLLCLAGFIALTVYWFRSMYRNPITTIVITFILMTMVLGGIETAGNLSAKSDAKKAFRLRNSRQVPDRAGITYESGADKPWGGKQTILTGRDGWLPIFTNTGSRPVTVEISAGGSICFYPGSRQHGYRAWIFSPDGLKGDRDGNISWADPKNYRFYPAPELPRCSLVARIDNSTPFFVGTGPVNAELAPDQRLLVTSNDNAKSDNSDSRSHRKWWIKTETL